MALLHLEALPTRTKKGTLVRLLTQVGQLDRGRIGTIEVRGRTATIEVPAAWINRLVKALDGTRLGDQHIRVWHERELTSGQEDHFSSLLRLLELEAEAEAEQSRRRTQKLTLREAERAGTSLIDLVVVAETSGLGGRCLVTLRKADQTQKLPWTRLNVGAPVILSQQGTGDETCRAVVSRRSERTIEIALSQPTPTQFSEARCRLDHSSDEVARQRQRVALHRVATASGERLAVLREVLLGNQSPGFRELSDVHFLSEDLNDSQKKAVQWALAAEDVAIIHGPPGTGKTTTVVELIRQAVQRGERVLACAPSNLAVDNVLEKLLHAGARAIRLGHPARVLPELREHTLDLVVEEQEDVRLARKLTKDAYALLDRAARYTRAKPAPGARREQREEARQMLADARRLEAQAVRYLLDSVDVLCATLTGIDSEVVGQRGFDLLVIDEACQSTEPAAWIPVLRSHRVVLAGDHCQLPPTVVSRAAVREGFNVSLLERLMQQSHGKIAQQLVTQYRMHAQIMSFSSSEFYHESLLTHASVESHCLSDLPDVKATDATKTPLCFVDTAGASYNEEDEPDGESRRNSGEVEIAQRRVNELLEAGLVPRQIAIISPYAAQVRLLRERIGVLGLEIDTVDGFQGREKEAVIISLVRSNTRGEIGFLADTRRMNVALTRARRKLIVIGDSATIANHPFYQRFLEYVELYSAYRTVWEDQ